MPDDDKPSDFAVPDAFAALAKALAAEAVESPDSFKRAGAFREAVLKLASRWKAGDPPHTLRTPKSAGAQPAAADAGAEG